MKAFVALLAVGIVSVGALGAEKVAWPQFRGPGGSGVADSQKPPLELGPDKNVKWKIPVPSGLSSPIVAGDNLVVTAFEDGKLYTIAYRRADGKEAWRAEAPVKKLEGYHKTEGSPAASTPATDGERIVSYFGSCGLFCYDLSGKELWKFELPPAAIAGDFGSGVSPIIADGLAVLVRDQLKDPNIYAVSMADGKVKWQKKRTSPSSYATPVTWNTPAGKQVVAAGHARIIGYDLATGEEKWSATGVPSGVCNSPVTADGVLYFAGSGPTGPDDKEYQMPPFEDILKQAGEEKLGYLTRAGSEKTMLKGYFDNNDLNKDGKITRDEWETLRKFFTDGKNSAFALKPGGSGDVSNSHVLWTKKKGLPYITSAIVYRGQYVMVKDGGIVTAYDTKTGAEAFQERITTGKYYASPVAANGHIYFTSLDGAVSVLKAGAEKPVVVKNPKLDERTAATPAIADDTLYIRTDKYLYAFAEKK